MNRLYRVKDPVNIIIDSCVDSIFVLSATAIPPRDDTYQHSTVCFWILDGKRTPTIPLTGISAAIFVSRTEHVSRNVVVGIGLFANRLRNDGDCSFLKPWCSSSRLFATSPTGNHPCFVWPEQGEVTVRAGKANGLNIVSKHNFILKLNQSHIRIKGTGSIMRMNLHSFYIGGLLGVFVLLSNVFSKSHINIGWRKVA